MAITAENPMKIQRKTNNVSLTSGRRVLGPCHPKKLGRYWMIYPIIG
jgi:hypothetical protein